ncbi:MAG: RCC1 domain-containing protein [Sandaracinaceae bacterium]
MRRILPHLVACSLGAAACREPPQVHVRMTADVELADRASALRVEVYGTDGREVAHTDQTTLAPGDLVDRAIGVTLAPEGNDASRGWRIVATLLEGDAPETRVAIAEQEAAGRYRDGVRRVNLHFDAACADALICGRGEACELGRCESACVSGVDPVGGERSSRAPCECAFAADGTRCADAGGEPGRCWVGECCTGCFDGTACVRGDDAAACGALGVECATCCAGAGCEEGGTCDAQAAGIDGTANHTCAGRTGAIACWGANESGQLGTGDLEPAAGVVVHDGFTGTPYAGDHHTCFVSYDQEISCWGANQSGQLGFWDGEVLSPPRPIRPYIFRSMALGEDHTCARAFVDDTRADVSVFCWGNDGNEQVGPNGIDAPVPELDGRDFTAVAAFRDTSCALTGTEVYCRGRNSDAQVGLPPMNNGTDNVAPAVRVHADLAWRQIAPNQFGACGLTVDGELYCWGRLRSYMLGEDLEQLEASGTMHLPRRLAEGSWEQISVGFNHGCAIDADRALYCFGANDDGRVGVDPARFPSANRPVPAGPIGWRWVDVVAGQEHTCAVRENGGVYCWGSNAAHQLARPNPSAGPPLTSWRALPVCDL